MQTIFSIPRRILNIINKRGIINAFKFVYSRYWFLLWYRIKVEKILAPDQIGVVDGQHLSNAHFYEAISHYSFNRMLKNINWDWCSSTFLDYGSGKGAALILAINFKFKKYIGVEFSPFLIEQCEINIEKFIRKKRLKIDYEIVCTDATQYIIPDDVNVFYFFNPFDIFVLEIVLQKIEESLNKNKRDILLLYFNAINQDLVLTYNYKIIYAEQIDRITGYVAGNYAFEKLKN